LRTECEIEQEPDNAVIKRVIDNYMQRGRADEEREGQSELNWRLF
jgi:hypothetical protein